MTDTPTQRENGCCSKCYGRQGTLAGGGVYCFDSNCPCHLKTSKTYTESVGTHEVTIPFATPPTGWRNREPWCSIEGSLYDVVDFDDYDIPTALRDIKGYVDSYVANLEKEARREERERICQMLEVAKIGSTPEGSKIATSTVITTVEHAQSIYDEMIKPVL